MAPAVRRTLLGVAVLLLLALSWLGLSGGVTQLPESHTAGEWTQTVSQMAYGLLALLSVLTTLWRRRWGPWVQSAWLVSVALAACLGAVVWGDSSLLTGLVSAAAALLVALGILWLLRVGARGLTPG